MNKLFTKTLRYFFVALILIAIHQKTNAQCSLAASFTYTVGAANSVSFTSTSTGTIVTSNYTWYYGDTNMGAGITSSHTYSAPGSYYVILAVSNSSACVDTVGVYISVTGPCNINASFVSTPLSNGGYSFTSTSTGTANNASYYWDANSVNFAQGNPVTNTFINGTYTITLYADNNYSPTCASSASQVITVSNNTCNLVASFTHTVGSANTVSFTSTSVGTISASTYSWNYGDSNSGTGNPTNHTYGSPGFYWASLFVDNGNGCTDSITTGINIIAPCNLLANFVSTPLSNGGYSFTSTSTGTTNITSYYWDANNSAFASGDPVTYTFPNGTYTITLNADNNYSPTCTSSVSQVITVSNNTCIISASFTYSQGTNGLVNFVSTSTGTNASTMYYWDFGDGFNLTGGSTTSHTYSNAGIHNVMLVAYDGNSPTCADTIYNNVNITTVPCVANSAFTMSMITSGWWQATPAYPYNVSWAQWDWGDNSQSNNLITSHTYSPVGLYTICLTVSVSCGATSTTCLTYSITRTSSPITMAYVNVVMPQSTNLTSGIKQQSIVTENVFVYPNPSNDKFEIRLIGINEDRAKIKIYDVTGKMIYEANGTIEYGNLSHTVKLDQKPGIYFIKIESGSGVITKKIILKD